ncbi:30S ribosomal protein S18 [bacterium]|nr:MAG: 30S ribosomal protein S18 [bacterium]
MEKKKQSNRKNRKKKQEHRRHRQCPFCANPNIDIDYKNIDLLRRYVNDRGKIVPRKNTGVCAKHQRRLAKEIKRARFLALIPYVVYTYR